MKGNNGLWLMGALVAPAIAVGCTLPWVYVAIATLVGAGFWYLTPAISLPTDFLRVWGKGAGAWILVLQAGFFALLLGQFALGTVSAFPDDPVHPFLPLSMLAVAWFSVSRGEGACRRGCRVAGAVTAVILMAVCFFAFGRADFSRGWTKLPAPSMGEYALVLLLPLCGRQLLGGGRLGVWGLFSLLPITASFLCQCIAGSGGSFYAMAKSVEVLSFAQRIEPLVSAFMTVGWFCTLCLLALVAVKNLRMVGVPRSWAERGIFLSAMGIVLLSKSISAEILFPIGTVFCVFLPLLTQGIGVRKKVKNFLKFQQKKC